MEWRASAPANTSSDTTERHSRRHCLSLTPTARSGYSRWALRLLRATPTDRTRAIRRGLAGTLCLQSPASVTRKREGGKGKTEGRLSGTQVTCFTRTKVQILTTEGRRRASIASRSFSEESDADDSYNYEPLTHAATAEAAEGLRHERRSPRSSESISYAERGRGSWTGRERGSGRAYKGVSDSGSDDKNEVRGYAGGTKHVREGAVCETSALAGYEPAAGSRKRASKHSMSHSKATQHAAPFDALPSSGGKGNSLPPGGGVCIVQQKSPMLTTTMSRCTGEDILSAANVKAAGGRDATSTTIRACAPARDDRPLKRFSLRRGSQQRRVDDAGMGGVDEDEHLKREIAAVRLRYCLMLVCLKAT